MHSDWWEGRGLSVSSAFAHDCPLTAGAGPTLPAVVSRGFPWFPVVSRGQANSGSNGVDSGPTVSPRVAQLASSSSTAYVEVVVAWVTMGCAWSP